MKDPDFFIPDPRAKIYEYLEMPTLSDPAAVQNEVVETLDSGELDKNTFLYAALPLLQRIGLPIRAGIGIIIGSLSSEDFDEADVRIILSVLITTGSSRAYSTEIEQACTRFAGLRNMVQ